VRSGAGTPAEDAARSLRLSAAITPETAHGVYVAGHHEVERIRSRAAKLVVAQHFWQQNATAQFKDLADNNVLMLDLSDPISTRL
jgi:hypothetical protein